MPGCFNIVLANAPVFDLFLPLKNFFLSGFIKKLLVKLKPTSVPFSPIA